LYTAPKLRYDPAAAYKTILRAGPYGTDSEYHLHNDNFSRAVASLRQFSWASRRVPAALLSVGGSCMLRVGVLSTLLEHTVELV
jgi:hypothetical protein